MQEWILEKSSEMQAYRCLVVHVLAGNVLLLYVPGFVHSYTCSRSNSLHEVQQSRYHALLTLIFHGFVGKANCILVLARMEKMNAI